MKTLKDLFFENHNHSEDGTPCIYNSEKFEKKVKAEAIKWVKNCSCKKIKIKIQDNNEPIKEEWHRNYCFACLRFIEFFNITEEDLLK